MESIFQRQWGDPREQAGEMPMLWNNEALNKKATRYIREHANVKGQPNLTVRMFCQWVNDDLFPNETLEPGFP